MTHDARQSYSPVVPEKPPNNAVEPAAEAGEERGLAKGNSPKRTASRTQRRLATIIELWEAVIPSELAAHTSVTGLRGGVLFVRVDSASVAYELDRRLRDGLEQVLRSKFPSTLVRIRVSSGR